MKYYGIMPKRKLWVIIAVILFALYAIISAVIMHNWVYAPIGVILLLATFSNRKQIVSEDGVDILYTVLGAEFHNLWSFEEIETIHTDSIKSRPNIELHFSKGVINRRFIFSQDDAKKSIDIAKNMNSNIYIAEVNHK